MGYFGQSRSDSVLAIVGAVLGIVLGLAAAIYLCVAVMPEKKRTSLPPVLKKIAYLLSMDYLVIEKIMTFIYILGTCTCITYGICTLIFGPARLAGIGMALIGPFVCRLAYEGTMLFIMLVTNVMKINGKIKGEENAQPFGSFDTSIFRSEKPAQPVYPQQYQQPYNGYQPAPGQYQPAPAPAPQYQTAPAPYQPTPGQYQPAPAPYQPAPEQAPAPEQYQPAPAPYQPAPEQAPEQSPVQNEQPPVQQ